MPYALQGMETKNYKDNIEPFLLEVGLLAMKLRDELDGGESKKGLDQIYDPHDPEAYGFPVHNDEYRDPKFKQFRRAFSKIAVAIVTDDEDCETEIGRIHIDIKDVKKGFRVEGVGDVQGGSKLQHQISTMVLQMPFGERRQYPPELSCAAESEVSFHYRFGPTERRRTGSSRTRRRKSRFPVPLPRRKAARNLRSCLAPTTKFFTG